MITLLYSGLKPSQVTTLAALDSTRLRSELAKHFNMSPDKIQNCRTYGGTANRWLYSLLRQLLMASL